MGFIKKSIGFIVICLFLFCILQVNANAKLIITTKIATGIILNIQDKAIEIEGGSTYFPFNKTITLNLQPGDLITLEFYVDSEGIKKYVAFALGENTLEASGPPEQIEKEPLY